MLHRTVQAATGAAVPTSNMQPAYTLPAFLLHISRSKDPESDLEWFQIFQQCPYSNNMQPDSSRILKILDSEI